MPRENDHNEQEIDIPLRRRRCFPTKHFALLVVVVMLASLYKFCSQFVRGKATIEKMMTKTDGGSFQRDGNKTYSREVFCLTNANGNLSQMESYLEYTGRHFTPSIELFFGPAAPVRSDVDDKALVFPFPDEVDAVCEFRELKGRLWTHFPHAQQQLLRCFSWWQANPNKNPVLIIKAIVGDYTEGYLQAIKETFHVRLDRTSETKNISVYVKTQPQPFEMGSPQDALHLRRGILSFYNISNTHENLLAGCPLPNTAQKDTAQQKELPVIGFLNRKKDRHVDNHAEIVNSLKENFGSDLIIRYLDSFDDLSFLDQITYMSQVDLLVGPHGAQLTSIGFIPTCGGLLELFPKGYYVPSFFGSLALVTGHSHLTLYTGNNRTVESEYYMETYERRSRVRQCHITAQTDLVIEAVEELTRRWRSCCKNKTHHDAAPK